MQIDRIHELELTPGDEADIAALLARCFSSDFGGRSFHIQRHHLRFVARDPDIVGHMALCLRAIRLGDRLVDIIGLAEVCTAPERRGAGIASRLMTEALAAARESGAAFFLLFGARPLYAGVGFVVHDNEIRYVELDGARTGEVRLARRGELMVLPLTDLPWDGAAQVDLLGHLF
jgi:predicted N-acetyltransferase YhbS